MFLERRVPDLEIPMPIDQQVLRFQVSMEDPPRMQVAESEAQLTHETLQMIMRDSIWSAW